MIPPFQCQASLGNSDATMQRVCRAPSTCGHPALWEGRVIRRRQPSARQHGTRFKVRRWRRPRTRLSPTRPFLAWTLTTQCHRKQRGTRKRPAKDWDTYMLQLQHAFVCQLPAVHGKSMMTINLWGHCLPQDCEWGEVPFVLLNFPSFEPVYQRGLPT